ncbi:Cof-type HAD-IIB family hydrolase [Geosporobacter ferrireducens]|uniref:Cof-type HAD-IIB family hydrolase n=1 Tax=Geosporobacter ferrireducens TaxID=1424294 RepID=UPI0023544117|nr:Cof-type HAD-IIB family hydrolase [Geosporobacter ferrireducens]
MSYRLVVTDMDGTLLNGEGKVSEENQRIFKVLHDKGIHVAVATGRIYTSARVFARYLGIKTPIIACNGAIVKDLKDNRIIYENHLSTEDCLRIVDICRKYDLYYHFYSQETFYTEKLDRGSLKYSEWNKTLKEEDRIDIRIIEDTYETIKNKADRVYKFQVVSDDMNILAQARDALENIETISVSKSWHNNIEMMNKGVSKGIAVKSLAESLGVKQEEVICFGDNENDISMLEYAGLGVAMGNADEIVKERANYVTLTNDEDGVAAAIKKFVL